MTELTIREIAGYVNWGDVKRALRYLYPSDHNNYKELFLSLPGRKEKKIKGEYLTISGGIDTRTQWWKKNHKKILNDLKSGEDCQWYNVYIFDKNKKSTFSCSFVEWDTMVNMPINPETMRNFKLCEIIAHFLWEITFFGNEKQMLKHAKQLEKAVEDIESGKAKTVPADDIMDKITKKTGVKPAK